VEDVRRKQRREGGAEKRTPQGLRDSTARGMKTQRHFHSLNPTSYIKFDFGRNERGVSPAADGAVSIWTVSASVLDCDGKTKHRMFLIVSCNYE
jgi:hypothetical protein